MLVYIYICRERPREAFGDEASVKNVFRAAVQNGTVRPPHSRFNQCITCEYYHSSPTLMHSCAIPHRGEMHHRNVADMSDKQIEMLLKRDSSHH